MLEPLPDDWTRALAVVAHPDDLEYGAASAVAGWTAAGREVGYLLVTRGEAGIDAIEPERAGELRAAEEHRSAAVVGVGTVEFLEGHRDGVIEPGLGLRRDLARAIRRHRPEVLVTVNHHATWGPGGLNMADHRVVGRAAFDAARDAGNRWVFPELLAEGFEPWPGVRYGFVAGSPRAAHAVAVGERELALGVASLREHRVYLEHLPAGTLGTDPEALIRGRAAEAGRASGVPAAVAFELLAL